MIKASDFGSSFAWGASSSAPQTEGAMEADGRKPSIWDVFAQKKGKVKNNDSPTNATEFY